MSHHFEDSLNSRYHSPRKKRRTHQFYIMLGKLMPWFFLLSLTILFNGFTSVPAHGGSHDQLLQAAGLSSVGDLRPAPKFELTDSTGKTVRLSDYQGKVVFINFWATWCPTCVHEMPMMDQLYQARTNQPFTVIAINMQESAEEVAAFMTQKGFHFPALIDSAGITMLQYKVLGLPSSYLIDCQSNLIGAITGLLQWTSAATTSLLDTLIKDKACQAS